MQKILSVEIKNIGPVKGLLRVEFDVAAPLTVITGANGCGKSTLLKAIATLQTNTLFGVKENILNWDCTSGYMKGVFLDDNGKKYTHYIGFGKKACQWLEKPDGIKFTKSKDITTFLEDYFNTSSKTLLRTLFVNQGDIFSLLSDQKSERAKLISELAGVDCAEQIWTSVGKKIGEFVIDPEAPGKKAMAEKLLDESDQRLKGAVATLEAFDSSLSLDEFALHKIINDYSRRFTLENVVRDNVVAESDVELSATLRRTVIQKNDEKTKAEAKLVALPTAEACHDVINKFSKAELLLKDKANYEAMDKKLKEYINSNPQRPVDDLPDLDPLKELLTVAKSVYQEAISNLKKIGDGNCPTCSQALPDAPKHIHDNTVKQDKSTKAIAKLTTQISELADKKKAIADTQVAFDKKHSLYLLKRQEADKFFAALATLNPPSQEVVNKAISDLDEIKKLTEFVRTAEREVSDLSNKRQALDLQLKTKTDSTIKAIEELEKLPSKVEAENAKSALIKLTEQKAQLNELKAKKQVAEFEVSNRKVEQAKAESAFVEFLKSKKVVANLMAVREYFHRDKLPSLVAAQFIEHTAQRAKEYLSAFEGDFSLAGDLENCTFVAEYADGKKLPIDLLSGGWKNIAALSIRCAASDLISRTSKLLVLDECIIFLDQANSARVPFVLEKIRAVNTTLGRQLLLVSHEPSIVAVADSTISIKGYVTDNGQDKD